ncbi:MAG: S9 family peptidase [Planctomycetales bacterium]|nr:S9 family peptidase [bacterium]UNM08959.1 MAG: S9 family peptidase [Planctomycetales bacterium]
MTDNPLPRAALNYPDSRLDSTVDDYHGEQVADPYRWLEEIRSAETEAWVDAQNELTEGYLSAIDERSAILDRLMRLATGGHRGLPQEAGGLYFRMLNDGSHDQDQLFVSEGLDGEPRLLLDPNTFSDNGSVSLAMWSPSRDGTKLLYGTSESGSDWTTWRVRDVATGADLPDITRWGKYANAAWETDGSSFIYKRYPEPQPGREHMDGSHAASIHRHVLGEEQAADAMLFSMPDRQDEGIFFGLNHLRDLLVIYNGRRGMPGNRIILIDLQGDAQPVVLVDSYDHSLFLLGNDADRLWFRTDHNAPNHRIIEIERGSPDPANWRELVPEQPEALRVAALYGGCFACQYLEHAASVMRVFATDGTELDRLALPGNGNVENMHGSAGSGEFFLDYTDAITPDCTLRVDISALPSGNASVTAIDPAPDNGWDPALYETSTMFYESADGTRVPLHLAHRKGLKPGNYLPTILYGYGGFNIAQIPKFTPARAAWLEMGGLFAIAGIRGGSEYGKAWHHAAIKQNRQRAYEDFIAAAEYLLREGWTTREQLAIQGRSNGGLLVGAVMCQRPELFAVALPQVGVMDMLRFNQFTAGPFWESDYGSPQNEAEYRAIRAYSPLHNLHEGTCYPSTLVTTGDTDDRVVPSHSYKFAARLQAVQSCDKPTLIRIDTRAGHGQGKPIAQEMREFADMYAFALHNMGVTTVS